MLALLVVLVLTCHTRFGALGQKGSRHQEQNREGGKAQSGQYITGWAGLLETQCLHNLQSLQLQFGISIGRYHGDSTWTLEEQIERTFSLYNFFS